MGLLVQIITLWMPLYEELLSLPSTLPCCTVYSKTSPELWMNTPNFNMATSLLIEQPYNYLNQYPCVFLVIVKCLELDFFQMHIIIKLICLLMWTLTKHKLWLKHEVKRYYGTVWVHSFCQVYLYLYRIEFHSSFREPRFSFITHCEVIFVQNQRGLVETDYLISCYFCAGFAFLVLYWCLYVSFMFHFQLRLLHSAFWLTANILSGDVMNLEYCGLLSVIRLLWHDLYMLFSYTCLLFHLYCLFAIFCIVC